MSRADLDDAALGEAFRNPPVGAGESGDCPASDRILDAVLGRAPRSAARDLAEHAATCPACAVAWRFARDYAVDSDLLPRHAIRPRWRPLAAAAALVAIVLVGTLWIGRGVLRGPAESGYRTLPYETIESLIGEGPLPADAFVLRWTGAGEGVRYDVRVTDTRLTEIIEARSLSLTEYAVPVEVLVGFESGDIVLWQVEVRRPNGSKTVSPTFAVRLE
jgi:hypothetical protein